MFIDLHCDTVALLHEHPEYGSLKKNTRCVDIEKLRKGGSAAQFFALFVDQKTVKNPLNHALSLLDWFYRELAENAEEIALAKNAAQFFSNRRDGKLSAFLTIEEGGVICGKLNNLRNFHRLGVRLMTLTWNYPNEIGYPNHKYTYRDKGLTQFGRLCVEEMNRLGMIVDVSHLSDRGFYDVAEIAKKPFVASHSNSRAMTDHCRNLTDDMIRLLAEKGGVMGINFARDFLGASPVGRIEDMIRHIRHIHQTGGIDVLAIGSDFDGIDPQIEIEHFGQMDKLSSALKSCGFSEDSVDQICYKNSLRVIQDCLGSPR